TELITGMDLIKLQIQIAAGERLKKRDAKPRGHAIECRINAEDVSHDFRPSPGEITGFHLPGGFGVRVDTHCYSGYHIPPYYDSLIAKLIVHAPTRAEAIHKMTAALEEFTIEGVHTTIPFQRLVMKDHVFKSGTYDTSYVEKMKAGD
ncbi:MAG TPA: acetyl-CoA carboxylase biotin carboxylase subunit, partial [Bacteroidota bacterium]|nr:acetyl-CoA carboxylase biotin carboxylase subunit [Bacteroidota bacterium]